jgi:N6-L-threonylcarbamoyladenine synthase
MLKDGLNFSFSGLKTRVRAIYREENMDSLPADARELKDLAAAFQAACVEVLAAKLLRAALQTGSKAAFLAGGVAANKALRARARGLLGGAGVPLHAPPAAWCADNASMIGCLGALQLERGVNILRADSEARARWPVDEDL